MNEKYWGEKKPPLKKNVQDKATEKHIAVHENKIGPHGSQRFLG